MGVGGAHLQEKQEKQYMTDDIESDSDDAPSAPPPGRCSYTHVYNRI